MRPVVALAGAVFAACMISLLGCSGAPGTWRVIVEMEGTGTLVSEPAGIFCKAQGGDTAGDCDMSFDASKSHLMLVATPAPGWRFAGWSVEKGAAKPSWLGGTRLRIAAADGDFQAFKARFEQTEGADGGTPDGTDGGTPDAGEPDAGTDGGMEPTGDVLEVLAVEAGTTQDLSTVVHHPGAGLFAAGGPQGTVAISFDGQAWNLGSTGGTTDSNVLIASDIGLVSVDTSAVFRTENGMTWTASGTLAGVAKAHGGLWVNGLYLVFAEDATNTGMVMSSEDGSTWSLNLKAPGPGSVPLDGLWTGTGFVVVGTAGLVLQSTDASSWMPNFGQTASAKDLFAVAQSSTLVMALGGPAGEVDTIVSADKGNTWTRAAGTFPPGVEIRDLAWTGTAFAAVGSQGQVYTSLDGAEWIAMPSTLPNRQLLGIAASDSSAIAVGEGGAVGRISTRTEARQELVRTASGTTQPFSSVVYHSGAGLFAAGGAQGTVAMSFDQGQTWNVGSTGGTGSSNHLVATAIGLVSVDGASVYATENGMTWTASGTLSGVAKSHGALWHDGLFLIFSEDASNTGVIMGSTDGTTWTQYLKAPGPGSVPYEGVWTGTGYVVVGTAGLVLQSTDAVSWMPNFGQTASAKDLFAVAQSPTLVMALGGPAGEVDTIVSADKGNTWTKAAGTFPPGVEIRDLVWTGEAFAAVGSNGKLFTSTDGAKWVVQASSVGAAQLTAVAAGPSVVAVGEGGVTGLLTP